MASLEVDFCGLKFKNPVIAASLETTNSPDLMRQCFDYGASGAIIKTLTDMEGMARLTENSKYAILNDRGQVVRLGLAEVELGKKEFTWQFARQVSLLKTRTEDFPVRISGVEEWGIMGDSIPYWFDRDLITVDELPEASERFAQAINEQLAASGYRSRGISWNTKSKPPARADV